MIKQALWTLVIGALASASLTALCGVAKHGAQPASPPPVVRNAAVAILRQRRPPVRDGAFRLPRRYAAASIDGRAYVTTGANGLRMVLLPVWRGKGANLRGYLYCSKPLVAADTETDPDGSGQKAITVYAPSPSPQPVRNEVLLEQKLNAHWYRVSRSVD